jgi:hypothetical protein
LQPVQPPPVLEAAFTEPPRIQPVERFQTVDEFKPAEKLNTPSSNLVDDSDLVRVTDDF